MPAKSDFFISPISGFSLIFLIASANLSFNFLSFNFLKYFAAPVDIITSVSIINPPQIHPHSLLHFFLYLILISELQA